MNPSVSPRLKHLRRIKRVLEAYFLCILTRGHEVFVQFCSAFCSPNLFFLEDILSIGGVKVLSFLKPL